MLSFYEISLVVLILYLLPFYMFIGPALIASVLKFTNPKQRILNIAAFITAPFLLPVFLLIISVNFFISLRMSFITFYFPFLAKRIKGLEKKLFELRNQTRTYYNNIKKDISSARPFPLQQVLAFSYVSLYVTTLVLEGGVNTRLAGDFTTDAPPPKNKKKRKSKGK